MRKKISRDSLQNRGKYGQTHRYYTISHKLKPVASIYTGKYLRSPDRQAPPAMIAEAMGTSVPPALFTQPDREAERAKSNPRLEAKLEATPKTTEDSSDVGA